MKKLLSPAWDIRGNCTVQTKRYLSTLNIGLNYCRVI